MYPGLGLGVIASTAKLVDQSLLSAAAHALGGIVNASQPGAACAPSCEQNYFFSQHLAEVVAQHAIDPSEYKREYYRCTCCCRAYKNGILAMNRWKVQVIL